MIPDATFEPAPPSKVRLRFSLLALLIFVTLVCIGLAWWVQPNKVVATALFQVSRVTPTILDAEAGRIGEHDFETTKKTQVAFLKSYFVLEAALRNPGIASLPIVASRKDPVAWLQEHLEIDFPQQAELLAISLRGQEAHAEDLVIIVDAVAKAYQDEVIYADKQRRLASRDLLARSLERLNQEIADKWEQLLGIARETGRLESGVQDVRQEIDVRRLERVENELMRLEGELLQAQIQEEEQQNAKFLEQRIEQLREQQKELEKKVTARSEKSIELETRKRELEQLQRIADEMSTRLEMMDIESQAPSRIEQRQRAVISR